jgi:hypothetical protein
MRALSRTAFVIVALTAASASADDADLQDEAVDESCRPVFGRFRASSVPPPECTSPVALCTRGELTGALRGEYALTITSLVPTAEPTVPFVTYFGGASTVSSRHLDFVGTDTGALNTSPPGVIGSGAFSTLLTVTEGATGYLWIRGKLDFITGQVRGTYAGQICRE